jgi:hypothetical protein
MYDHASRMGAQLAWLDHHGISGTGVWSALQTFLHQFPATVNGVTITRSAVIMSYVDSYSRTSSTLRALDPPIVRVEIGAVTK